MSAVGQLNVPTIFIRVIPLRLKLKCDRKLPCGSCSTSELTKMFQSLNLSQLGEVVRHYVPTVCLLRATVLGKFEVEFLRP